MQRTRLAVLRALLGGALPLSALLWPVAGCGGRDTPEPAAPARVYDADGRTQRPLTSGAPRPNIVLLLIDTLRADAVDPTADARPSMPLLSRRAQRGVCFTDASSAASWTLPSIMSLFTGVLPRDHGVTTEDLHAPNVAHLTTWAEVLRSSLGYQTAVSFGSFTPGMLEALGQGFETIRDGFQLQRIDAELDAFDARRDPARPFFLALHSFEAHDPYGAANHPPGATPPEQRSRDQAAALASLEALGAEPSISELVLRAVTDDAQRLVLRQHPRFRPFQAEITRYLWSGLATQPDPTLAGRIESAYRAGLGWVDEQVELAWQSLERRGLLKNTLLIVTGDHGEAFGEHGMLLHGRQLYDELLRVPLVLTGPPPFDRPRVIGGSVGLTDLFPSMLAWLGAPAADALEGRSFLPLLATGGPGRAVEAEEVRTHMHTAGLSAAVLGSVRSKTWKYIGTYDILAGTLTEEAYERISDPGERHNLAGADHLVRALPFDDDFCAAVERTRNRLWGSLAQGTWRQDQGYASGTASGAAHRPPSSCTPPR